MLLRSSGRDDTSIANGQLFLAQGSCGYDGIVIPTGAPKERSGGTYGCFRGPTRSLRAAPTAKPFAPQNSL
jgi:hypothetical protein